MCNKYYSSRKLGLSIEMFQTLSLAFSFIFFLILFFSIIDLPHLAIEDKRQETSGGDKLPHDLDKKREKREAHTNPFRKEKKKAE